MSHYPPQQGYGELQNHPPLPPGWRAEYDQREHRTVFINLQTGQRSFDFPHTSYPQTIGYSQQGYGQQVGYEQQPQGYGPGCYEPQQPTNNRKAMEYGGLGAVGGMALGALGVHEWDKRKSMTTLVLLGFPFLC
jgi:hypothetical protein